MASSDDSLERLFGDDSPSLGRVSEEGLLPGNKEARETFGDLGLSSLRLSTGDLRFMPLTEQSFLIHRTLTSEKYPLYYELSADGHYLSAKQGAHGPLVFEAKLFQDGSYHFMLHSPLDRAPPPNLVEEPNFETLHKTETEGMRKWQRLGNEESDKEVYLQNIPTKQGAPYQLSLYYGNHTDQTRFEVYWSNKLLQTFSDKQDCCKFLFSIDADSNMSQLKIVGHHLTQPLRDFLHEVKLIETSSQMLPIDFKFGLYGNDKMTSNGRFTVEVATEPPIIIEQQESMTIVYDQAIYQSIIVHESPVNPSSMPTLSLDALFSSLHIPPENRQVDVVQLSDHGNPTSMYEVHILDSHYPSTSIAIANVHLMFEGGEQGLDVFYKTVLVEE